MYRWELIKLRYQKRTYLGLGAAALVPILFVVAIHFRHHRGDGGDFAFPSYLTSSGLVVPLVILLFGAVWLFPLITALVAGDIFASEDHNGTLKTIFTRSLERWQIFAGKALADRDVRGGRDLHQRDGGGRRRQHPVGLQLGADACRGRSCRRPRRLELVVL